MVFKPDHAPQSEEVASVLSHEAVALLGEISTARFPSQLRGLSRRVAKEAAAQLLSPSEVEQVLAIRDVRLASMIIPTTPTGAQALVPPQAGAAPAEQWSPTAILDRLPQGEREPDWRERQLPPGDR